MTSLTTSHGIDEIICHLNDPQVTADIQQLRYVMRKVLHAMTSSADITELFPQMVKILAHNDLVVKKIACHYLVTNSTSNPDLTLMAINTLVKDCADPNPTIRGLALKTLCSLQHAELLEYLARCTLNALNDRSSYVRRVAVISCGKIHHLQPHFPRDHGMVDQLYSLIRDNDPVVLVNALATLEEILKEEGGVVINKNIAYYLINRMAQVSDLGLTVILNILMKYQPQNEEEMFEIMNVTDKYLQNSSASVTVACVNLFLHFVGGMPHLCTEVLQRSQQTLINSLNSGNPEMAFAVVNFVDGILATQPNAFEGKVQAFFCKYNEPTYLKLAKIGLLPKLMGENNANVIIDELCMNCSDVGSDVPCQAIESLGIIARSSILSFDKCLDKLVQLLNLEVDYITASVLNVLQTFVLTDIVSIQNVMEAVPKMVHELPDARGRAALVYLLGHYGQYLEESPYILEEFARDLGDEQESLVKQSLLTASMKLFFKRPAECQDMLGRILEYCSNDSDPNTSDKAKLYYRLISTDVQTTKLLFSASTGISSQQTAGLV